MLNFEAIKKISVADVATGRYHLQLAHKGDYATCTCPLPTHKQGDRSRCFSINLKGNYWRCFSETCNANNGGKRGGDAINFVALMEGCGPKDAAERLSGWYSVGQVRTPQPEPHLHRHYPRQAVTGGSGGTEEGSGPRRQE